MGSQFKCIPILLWQSHHQSCKYALPCMDLQTLATVPFQCSRPCRSLCQLRRECLTPCYQQVDCTEYIVATSSLTHFCVTGTWQNEICTIICSLGDRVYDENIFSQLNSVTFTRVTSHSCQCPYQIWMGTLNGNERAPWVYYGRTDSVCQLISLPWLNQSTHTIIIMVVASSTKIEPS